MSVSHCILLANYQTKSLFEFDSMEHIEPHFAPRRDELKGETAGICEEGEDCRCREDGGGDLCRIVGRCRAKVSVGMAEGEDGISQDRLPG